MPAGGAEGFSGRETILCDILTVDTCHYTFVNPTERGGQRRNPSANSECLLMIMCQHHLVKCNECRG